MPFSNRSTPHSSSSWGTNSDRPHRTRITTAIAALAIRTSENSAGTTVCISDCSAVWKKVVKISSIALLSIVPVRIIRDKNTYIIRYTHYNPIVKRNRKTLCEKMWNF